MLKKQFGMKLIICTLTLFIGVLLQSVPVRAAETESSVLDSINFEEIDDSIEELFNGYEFDFKSIVMSLIKGDMPFNAETIGDILLGAFQSQIYIYKETFIQILLIVLIAAIFTNFSSVFKNSQVADISFFIIYLLLFVILVKSFQEFGGTVSGTLSGIVTFMQALVPAYFMTVSFAAGGTTAAVFYQFILILILAVQWILLNFLIPAVNVYVLLNLVNHMSKEDFLSKLAKLIKTMIEWVLKTLFAAVIGINVIQGLVMPAVDAVKSSLINKTASALPGVGNALNAVTEIMLGSAVLIKNSVGIAVFIGLIILCAAPLVKLVAGTFLYKLIAAAVQPVSDARILGCISSVGEGIGLMLKILLNTLTLFLITIAMISTFTNRGY